MHFFLKQGVIPVCSSAAVLLVIFAVAVGIRYSKSRSHSAYVLLASQPTENEAS